MSSAARTREQFWPALRALRAKQWWYFVPLVAAEIDPARSVHGAAALARGASIAALLLGYAYGLNAVSDRATDRDEAKNPLRGCEACPPSVTLLIGLCGILAIALACSAGPSVLVAAAASLVAATLYSAGPHLKSLPLVGTLTNAAIFAPLLLLAPNTNSTSRSLPLLAGVFVILLLQNQLLHELVDAGEDEAAGALTTARLLGERLVGVAIVGLALGGIAFTVAAASSQLELATAAIAIFAATIVAAPRRISPARRRALHRVLSVIGGALLFAAASIGSS